MNKNADLCSPQAPAPQAAGLHTLLYIEDNGADLKLVEKIIARQRDIRLLAAVQGKSGIETARILKPDVIMMDINLPDINGFKALEVLRSDPVTAHIPVIALSANTMPLNIETGLEAGFFCYLTKPIRIDDFMNAINRALKFVRRTNGQHK